MVWDKKKCVDNLLKFNKDLVDYTNLLKLKNKCVETNYIP